MNRFLALALIATSARVSGAAELGELQQPIIYGEDDRLEVYEVDSDVLRARARESAVAITSSLALGYEDDGTLTVDGRTLGDAQNLCEGEAFADQPVLAWCSGVLIDDDLVATAGHCLGASLPETHSRCRSMSLVFDYLYDTEGRLAELSLDDVYRCRRVVTWSPAVNLEAPDFGVIQLDRPVDASRTPAPLAAEHVRVGQRVNVIGFGSGLPAKIESGGTVMDTTSLEEFFTADTDTFAGASGSPLFDDAGNVVGLHVRGQWDWDEGGACTTAVRTNQGAESHQHALSARAALCASGWPSERLCGTAAVCGDGICTAFESCDEDCPPPRCGDGLCEGTAEPLACAADCDTRPSVPESWTCEPSYFGDRLGCDCGCGARDVDCDDPREPVLNCAARRTCDADGACAFDPALTGDVGNASTDGSSDDGFDQFIVDGRELETDSYQPPGDDGCGCRVVSPRPLRSDLGLLLALLLVGCWRRRRTAP